MEKQADSGLGGWMLRKFHGEPLKPDHVLAFCQASFRMALSRTGFLMLAPGSRVHYEKHWAEGSTGWNQDFWEKYQ